MFLFQSLCLGLKLIVILSSLKRVPLHVVLTVIEFVVLCFVSLSVVVVYVCICVLCLHGKLSHQWKESALFILSVTPIAVSGLLYLMFGVRSREKVSDLCLHQPTSSQSHLTLWFIVQFIDILDKD